MNRILVKALAIVTLSAGPLALPAFATHELSQPPECTIQERLSTRACGSTGGH